MSKKKIFASLVALAIAGIAVTNVKVNSQTKGMSDLSLANVEALAGGEIEVLAICIENEDDFCEYEDGKYRYLDYPWRRLI